MWGEGQGIHLSQKLRNFPGFSSCAHNTTLNSTHPSFIHPSIHSRIHSSIHSVFKQLCVPTEAPATPISGGLNIFNERTPGYKWRVCSPGLCQPLQAPHHFQALLFDYHHLYWPQRGRDIIALWLLRVRSLVNCQASAAAPRSQCGGFLWPHLSSHQKRQKGGSRWHIIEYTAMDKPNKAKS